MKKGPTRRIILLAAVVVVIVGSVIGFAVYQSRVKPFKIAVVEVNGSRISMRYFLKRVAMSDGETMDTLGILTKEEILRQVALEPPYNISIIEQDIDQFIRDLARGENESIEESEFREWYRQQLNESRLSDEEYKELIKTTLLNLRMSDYLGEKLPNVADHAFLHMVPVKEYATAVEIKGKFDAGVGFADLAMEYSEDPRLKENGGEVGWYAQGALDPRIDEVAFDLEVGKMSDPIPIDERTFAVIMVSERVADRELDEESLWLIKSRVLDEWYDEEFKNHDVQFHGLENGYDSKTDAWARWQIARMSTKKER